MVGMIPRQDLPFKDVKGCWLTQSLFYECRRDNIYKPLYTLKDDDYKGFISIKKKYFELNDPTEYLIATTYFGGWEHWKQLCDAQFFSYYVNLWREELEIKQKCEMLRNLYEDPDQSFFVKKFLINKEYEVKRGRPSKEEIAKNNRINSNVNSQIENDFKVLKLNEK